MIYQQGDVLFEVIDSLPKDLVRVKPKERGNVVAEGEATGHAHVLTDIKNTCLYNSNNQLYLEVKIDSPVKHDEHKPITIPKGLYKIRKVVEYDHFLEESREVLD